MDIYSAEVQVNKLLNYVKSLSDSKPRMYQKSKDRLRELANNCSQVVLVISEILQDEALINDQDEFGSSGTNDFDSVLNSMENQISELRQFLRSPKPSIHNESSSSAKKQAICTYKHCLASLASSSIVVEEAEGCSKLLWDWFNCRFLEGPKNFKYNMKRIPNWIRDIVVLYGYHLESSTLSTFVDTFYKWLSTISSGTNNYAVPYEIYNFDSAPVANQMTLTSVVLWDILLDYGLRDICSDTSSEYFPSEDCVYSLVGSLNSSVMDPYQNYNYDQSILSTCNLTLKAGEAE